MKLIDEKKVREFMYAADFGCSTNDAFEQGVDFAESELKDLAIEFAEWCGTFYTYSDLYKIWESSRYSFTTSELFTKFITERTK